MPAAHTLPLHPRGRALPASVLAQAVDALAWPLLLLSGDGTLLHANRSARALLRHGQLLALDAAQRLQPCAESHRPAFSDALASALGGAAPVQLQWGGNEGRTPVSARLSRLRPEPGQPPLLMLSLSPEAGAGVDLSAFAAAHELSATETRVLQRLALGESSASAAAALGLQATTVRSHALNLRRKTGHASIGALVHAVARLAPVAVPQALPRQGE